MDLVLTRKRATEAGIFGVLSTSCGGWSCVTLEHAYPTDNGYAPKIPPGSYTCVFGPHMLHSGPIDTFEITGVPGHSGVLFHYGNTNTDSDGCVLLGRYDAGDCILKSREAFEEFLRQQSGLTTFQLQVAP